MLSEERSRSAMESSKLYIPRSTSEEEFVESRGQPANNPLRAPEKNL
jgi:hypothetical protein